MGLAAKNNGLTQSITEEFNKSAARYRESFPELLKNLFVFTPDRQIYVAPEIAALLSENAEDIKKRMASMGQHMDKTGAAAQATKAPYHFVEMNLVAMNMKPDSVSDPVFMFDHEMGHLVTREGTSKNRHVAECAADAFAALRHIQRYNGKTALIENEALQKAAHITLLSSPIHYTSASLQKVISVHKGGKIDIMALSLKETADLADKIAFECGVPEKTLKKIHTAYASLRGNTGEEGKIPSKLFQAIEQNKNDPDIYRAGRLFLERADIKACIAPQDLDRLQRHEKNIGFTLNPSDTTNAKPAAEKKRGFFSTSFFKNIMKI